MAKRIYELAKELNVSSKDMVSAAETKGFSVKNHMSTMGANEERYLREYFGKKKGRHLKPQLISRNQLRKIPQSQRLLNLRKSQLTDLQKPPQSVMLMWIIWTQNQQMKTAQVAVTTIITTIIVATTVVVAAIGTITVVTTAMVRRVNVTSRVTMALLKSYHNVKTNHFQKYWFTLLE